MRRLRRRIDFLAAAKGRRFHTERMTAQARARAQDEIRDGIAACGVHVGFTVTKRVGHATERNRIRRRLRGAVAALDAETPASPFDLVLVARRPALDAPFAALVDDLRKALRVLTKPRGGEVSRDRRAQDWNVADPGARGPGSSHVQRRPEAGREPDTSIVTRRPDGSTDG